MTDMACGAGVRVSIETLPTLSYQGQPVITTEALAAVYGTEAIRIQQNYARNAERFVEGKHFHRVEKGDLKALKAEMTGHLKDSQFGSGTISPNTRSLILWTARGAARHAKMLETEAAWEMFEKLEEAYFARAAGARPRAGQAFAAPERTPRSIDIVCDGDAPGCQWRERVQIDLDCPKLDPGEPAGVIHLVTGAVVVRRLAAPWRAAGNPERLGLAHFPGPENNARGYAATVVVVGALRRDTPDRR